MTNVNKRDAGQRVPRSGGRTVGERTRRGETRVPVAGRDTRPRQPRASATREFPVQGSTALRPAERVAVAQAQAPRLRVAPPPPVRVPRAPFVSLILVLVVGGVLGILLVNTKINENAFRLDKLQKQQAKLDIDQQQLEKQIAEAKAPGNLAAQARKLGLVESGPPAFIRLPDGRVIGVPQPAGGAPSITSQSGNGG